MTANEFILKWVSYITYLSRADRGMLIEEMEKDLETVILSSKT
jgi:hypothetical protein